MKRGPAPRPALPAHYGDLRAHATQWWALQRARIRLTQAAGAAKRAGWGTADDYLSTGLAAVAKVERQAARATVRACATVYPVIAKLVAETDGLGPAVSLFLGLVPPLVRLEDFPGFPCPAALWTYSGLSAKRVAKCDRRARMIAIAYLATPAIIRSPDFHALYTARRVTTATRGWTKIHAYRDAVRYVAKRILKYLWLCRLPVGSPQDSLAPLDQITVAGASPSVGLPTDTRVLRENPHGGEASASESVALPLNGVSPSNGLTAPEPALLPDAQLFPKVVVAAPEPVASPELLLRSFHDVTASETA